MRFLPEEPYKKIIVVSIYAILIVLSFTLLIKYIIWLMLPFILAWILSLAVTPATNFLHKKLKFPRKLTIALLVLLIIIIISVPLYLMLVRLLTEAKEFISTYIEDPDKIVAVLDSVKVRLNDWFPRLSEFTDVDPYTMLTDTVVSWVTDLSGKVPTWITSFAFSIPDILLFLVVLFLSTYYISSERDNIKAGLKSILSQDVFEKVKKGYGHIIASIIVYLRSMLIMLMITFVELLVSFYILGISYPWLIAAIVAFVDMLPVLGVGTVTIPWSIVLLITGDYYQAIGLLILYAMTTLVRQIIEPKILGTLAGVSPLVTLFAMYVGYKLLGVLGLILGPFISIIVGAVIKGWNNDRKSANNLPAPERGKAPGDEKVFNPASSGPDNDTDPEVQSAAKSRVFTKSTKR